VALDQHAKRVTVSAQDLLHCSFITGHHRTIRPLISLPVRNKLRKYRNAPKEMFLGRTHRA
jgi:hypothetical protein